VAGPRNGEALGRWAFLATEKNFRKIMGYRDLWMLEAILNRSKSATEGKVASYDDSQLPLPLSTALVTPSLFQHLISCSQPHNPAGTACHSTIAITVTTTE
jgi:hypothetical protein